MRDILWFGRGFYNEVSDILWFGRGFYDEVSDILWFGRGFYDEVRDIREKQERFSLWKLVIVIYELQSNQHYLVMDLGIQP